MFNGAHLRIERDAANWHDFFKPGGIDKVWTYYSEAAQQLGFNVTTPVYVATGVYEMKDVQAMQVCLTVYHNLIISLILFFTPTSRCPPHTHTPHTF